MRIPACFSRQVAHRWVRIAALILTVLSLAIPVSAQITSATLSGVIKDETGGNLPGVLVEVTNTDNGSVRSVVTDAEGGFVVPGLQPGSYRVRSSLTGFNPDVRSDLELSVGQQASVSITLTVAGASETVEVTGSIARLVETRSSSLSAVVDERSIERMPLNGRNFVDLALLQPGVASFRERATGGLSGRGQQMNINGAPGRSNSYLLDGANMKSFHGVAVSTAADTTLGVDTVREFRVVTNAFSADYGRAMGGVINVVTKAGGNQVTGSAFEFFRNGKMDARNYFDRGDPPPFERHQFGFTLGGPLLRNQLFAFGGVEGLIERLTTTQVSAVPTEAARSGAFGPVSPAVRPFLDLIPLPNGEPVGPGVARFSDLAVRDTDEFFGQLRLDGRVSDAGSVFVRGTVDRAKRRIPGNLPAVQSSQKSNNQWYTAGHDYVFTNRLLNTTRLSYSRLQLSARVETEIGPDLAFVPEQPTMGTIAVSGLTGFGPDTSIPQDANTDYLTFTNDVSYTRGHHLLKTGLLLERASTQTMLGNNIRGGYSFPSLARFLAGQPASFSSVLPGADITRSRSSLLFGAYLQDDWSVATRVVLNLGLRYETYGVPKDSGGQDSALRDVRNDKDFVLGPIFVNPSRANIGPRVGFAWDLTGDGRTSVRGGAGLYFDTDGVFNSSLLISTFAPPFASTINLINPAFPRPVLQGGSIGLSARTIDYNVGQPRMWTFNLSGQRELPGDLGLLVSYAGSRGYDLVRAVEGNPFVPQTLENGTLFVPASAGRVNPNWGSIDYRTTGGHSWYDALQVMLRKRFSGGYQFQASYTLSETTDETQGQVSLDVSNSSIYGQNPYDQVGDRGPADFDVRHVLTFNAAWDLPVGRSLTGLAGVFGKGWQVNALGTFRSGLPFTPTVGNNWSTSGLPTQNSVRPNLRSGANPNDGPQTPERWFDPSVFELQPAGTMGNASRNLLRGPGFANVDMALVKSQVLGASGSRTVEFRFEVFNILNRTNFAVPNRAVFAGARAEELPLATAGLITRTVTDARQIQLGLKLRF